MLENIHELEFYNEGVKINDKTKYILKIKCLRQTTYYQFFTTRSAFKFIFYLRITRMREKYFNSSFRIERVTKYGDEKIEKVLEHPTLYDKCGVKLNFKYFLDNYLQKRSVMTFPDGFLEARARYKMEFSEPVREEDLFTSSLECHSFGDCVALLSKLRNARDLFLKPTLEIYNKEGFLVDEDEYPPYIIPKPYPPKDVRIRRFPMLPPRPALLANPWIIFYLVNYLPICTKNDPCQEK